MAAQNHNSSANDTVQGEELQLEAMRKDDFSWHPCKVSLCSSAAGINVEYLKNCSDDVIMTKEEALARLRIRSTPLQGDECTLVQQGQRVLATRKSQSTDLFFEAEIEKPVRLRHSTKVHCRCTFLVRWICHGHEGETAVLPSSAIMKMSSKCIDAHPTIAAFFNILTTPASCNFPTAVEGMECEMDVFKLEIEGSDCEVDVLNLEKQIEEINNSADASGMENSENILVGVQVDIKGQAQYNSTAAYSSIQLSPFFNCMKEMEFKSSGPPPPISTQDFVKRRSPVNPIAARAALASLKSKSSCSAECSSTLKEANVLKPQPGINEMSKGGTPYSVSFVNNSSNLDEDFSLRTEASTAKYVPKNNNVVKTLFPTEEAAKDPGKLDALCEASEWEGSKKNEKCHPEIMDCVSNIASSATNTEMSMPSRLSRSARQRSSAISTKNVEMTCITETKLMPSTNTRRLTRSAVREAEKKITAEANNINKKQSSVQERDLLEEEETVVSLSDASTLSEKLKDQVGNRGLCDDKYSKRRTCTVGIQTSNLQRLTHSAVCGKTENNDMEHDKRFEESKLSNCIKSEILKGNITSESIASEREDSISSPVSNGICPTRSAGRCKKVQKPATIKTIEGDAASNNVCSRGIKRKSITPKKQQLRFSPRLRFLPRTRSQDKY